jgi:hypothetical protein
MRNCGQLTSLPCRQPCVIMGEQPTVDLQSRVG